MKNLPVKKQVVNIKKIVGWTIHMDINKEYHMFIDPLGTIFKLNGDTVLLDVSSLYDLSEVVDYIRSFND